MSTGVTRDGGSDGTVELQATLDYVEAVANSLLAAAEGVLATKEVDAALRYIRLAASILSRQNRILTSVKAEALLQRIAAAIDAPATVVGLPPKRKGCLHVLTEALPAGGLTAMVRRWIQNDTSGRIHRAVLLNQSVAVPDAFRAVVERTGGEVYVANAADGASAKAGWLRTLSTEIADHVALHIDVSDVICGAAFGRDGGPPVMLVNHSAHIFWIGATIADVTLNCRGSRLEGVWAETYRGIRRHAILPIPLHDTAAPSNRCDVATRAAARKRLDIPDGAIIIITVGAEFKYRPCNGLDFLETCAQAMSSIPEAILIAIGPNEDEYWRAAAAKVGGRIRALGVRDQQEIADLHASADIYVEGFPFGTTTALLEAASKGIPALLAPGTCPPPFGTDGIALDDTMTRPASVEQFAEALNLLCRNGEARGALGASLQSAVNDHHVGDGWRRHLADVMQGLPPRHTVNLRSQPRATPPSVHEYWSRFVIQHGVGYRGILEDSIHESLARGHKFQISSGVTASRRKLRNRSLQRIPFGLLQMLCNHLFALLPARSAWLIFRTTNYLFRSTWLLRLMRAFGHAEPQPAGAASWYQEFRSEQTR